MIGLLNDPSTANNTHKIRQHRASICIWVLEAVIALAFSEGLMFTYKCLVFFLTVNQNGAVSKQRALLSYIYSNIFGAAEYLSF